MYNNETAGPAFEEFLDLLGQRVRLKGFNKYRAQLDNKSKFAKESSKNGGGAGRGSYLQQWSCQYVMSPA